MTSQLHHHITLSHNLCLVVSLARDSLFIAAALLLLAVLAQACVLLTNLRRVCICWGLGLKGTGAKTEGYRQNEKTDFQAGKHDNLYY